MSLRFLSLASGSSGNCYYLGTEEYGILIDAGIGIRTIKKQLKEHNMEIINEDTDYKVKDYDYNNNWIVYNPEENED